MTNAERGRATNQHEQGKQQAALHGCVDAIAEMEDFSQPRTCVVVTSEDDTDRDRIETTIMLFFKHPERITVERFTNHALDDDALYHCDICGAAAGTCQCACQESVEVLEGNRRGDEEREA